MVPVPSKNALRAMRDLAFSTPTIVAGAVGSACCVAAACCEARSRVRLAEKIVATKRTLRSISDGRGHARVARMFEAAERGEDFLLDSRPAQKRRRARRYSTAIEQLKEEEKEEDIKALQEKLAAIPKQVEAGKKQHILENDKAIADIPGKEVAHHNRKPTAATHERGDDDLHRTRKAAMFAQPQDPPKHHVNGSRKSSSRETYPQSFPSVCSSARVQNRLFSPGEQESEQSRKAADRILQASMMQHKSTRTGAYHHPRPQRSVQALPIDPDSARVAEIADHSSPGPCRIDPKAGTLDIESGMHGKPEDTGFQREAVFADAELHDLTAASGPGSISDSPGEALADETTQSQDFNTKSEAAHAITGCSTPLAAQIPGNMDQELSHFVPFKTANSTASTESKMEESARRLIESNDLSRVSNKGFHPLMMTYLKQGRTDDARRIFHAAYRQEEHGLLPDAAAQLIHHFMENTETRGRAFDIITLVPPEKDYDAFRSFISARRIALYMDKFCATRRQGSTSAWVDEFYAIAETMRDRGIVLKSIAMETLLRALCSVGETAKAVVIYDDMIANFGMVPSLQIDRVLAMGHAKQHDWTSVNKIMERLQEQGVPRMRPKAYSILFDQLFRIHLRAHDLDTSYEYLINALAYWKLVPNATVMTVIIVACIKAQRYDYIQEWVETTRNMWPRLLSSSHIRDFSLQVSQTWVEMQASCTEVRNACQALAYGSLEDPFSRAFRGVVRDAIALALARTCNAVMEEAAMSPSGRPNFGPGSDTVGLAETLLRDMQLACGSTRELAPAARRLQAELQAVQDTDKIMHGYGSSEVGLFDLHPRMFQTIESAEVPPGVAQNASSSRNPQTGVNSRTSIPTVYAESATASNPLRHDKIKAIVAKLVSEDRRREALDLLRSVHESPYVTAKTGTFFDGPLYAQWLELSHRVHSYTDACVAMWGLLDASRVVTITGDHLILVGLCKHAQPRWTYMHGVSRPEQHQEISYLERRLRKVRWLQHGAGEGGGTGRPLKNWVTWQDRIQGHRVAEEKGRDAETY